MCGICGFFDRGGRRIADRDLVFGMLDTIRHRGPDENGAHVDGAVALGNARLSIIDVAGSHQPLYNENGQVVLVCNGEIYNFRELRKELIERGHCFSTEGDAEVIVHLYEEHGDRCVDFLRGMFAFAIWDRRAERLLLARDRLGIKPLYYTTVDGLLVFGSEIKALLRHPEVQASADLEGLSDFLSLKYVPSPRTLFEGIRALEPGHRLVADRSGVETERYWDFSFAGHDRAPGERESVERLAELLRESIRLRLVSDVPFGAFLSGGVDSSTIVALMSEFLSEPVRTFSVGFVGDGASYSELPFARIVAERFGTDHHEVIVGPENLTELTEKIIWHLDQPIADEACLANYLVSELAARHVKMVLTGEGGDELFAGYARYSGERLSRYLRWLPGPLRAAGPALLKRLPGLRRPKIAAYALAHADEAVRFTNWFPLFNQDMKARLMSPQMAEALNGASTARVFAEHLARTDATDPLSRMLYVDTKLWLPDDLLARGDKTSMAASLEARVPFLDHKLVEFAASLPPHYKLRGMTRKYLLKRACEEWLPDEIIHRPKEGFPIPIPVWFRGAARSYLHDLLSAESLGRRGLFDVGYVQRLLREHDDGFADHGSLLFGLLSVEVWYRKFIDPHRVGSMATPQPLAASQGAGRQGELR